MLKDWTRAPTESQESRLHREYAWSKLDGAITSNGIVYREQVLRDGLKGFKLYREPHHSVEQMSFAAEEIQASSPGATFAIAEIYTVESWGVAPALGV